MVALRLITNTTNERTAIGALLPAAALGHKAAMIVVLPGLYPSEKPQGQRMSERQLSHLHRGKA